MALFFPLSAGRQFMLADSISRLALAAVALCKWSGEAFENI